MGKKADIATGIILVNGNFVDCLNALKSKQTKMISLRDEAFARIASSGEGRANIGRTQGTWTSAGAEYASGQFPILNLCSRLNSPKMAMAVVEANRQGQYLSTSSTREYEQSFKRAQEDLNKDPQDRQHVLLPSRDTFEMSEEENFEVLQATLKDKAKEYLELNGKPIPFYLVDKSLVDGQKGTILTPMWFRSLVYGSDFNGYNGSANDDNYRARGVSYSAQVSATRSVAKDSSSERANKKVVEYYTPKDIQKALRKLGVSRLERQLMVELKRK